MWTGLLDEASEENVRALDSVKKGLDALQEALSDGSREDVAALMRGTREWRRES